jgi:Dolichyl-phosphate-mannose-protein mannosyltransferase
MVETCQRRSENSPEPGVLLRRLHSWALLAIVAGFVLLSFECIWWNPVVLDEFAHIPAAISQWQLGRVFLYRENPPLVRSLAAIPVVLSSPVMDYGRAEAGHRSEWEVGTDFISSNKPTYHLLITRARCVILLLAITCAALIFWWSAENYGGAVGVVSAALWLMDPTVLAHSSIATIDVGASVFCATASYTFWRFLLAPDARNALIAGIGLGLAVCSKFTMLALYPALTMVALAARFRSRKDAMNPGHAMTFRPSWGQLACIFGVSILLLNLAYGFGGTGTQLGRFEFRSDFLTGHGSKDPEIPALGNRFRDSWVSTLPVPLPRHYLLGLDSQKWDEELGFVRLSRGHLVKRGAWFSPLETLLYKLPMGTMALWVATLGYWIIRSRRFRVREGVSVLPAVMLLVVLGTQTGLNWPVRYALPIFPLLCVASGRLVQVLWASRLGRVAVLACLSLNVTSLLAARPNYLSFANALAGDNVGGRRYFLGSNYDWGQDLFRLRKWYASQPDRRPISMAYYGVLSSETLGLPTVGLPETFLASAGEEPKDVDSQEAFYWVVSANILNGMPGYITLRDGLSLYGLIRSDKLPFDAAFARVGDTLYVFRIEPDNSGTATKALTHAQLRGCVRPATDLDRKTYVSP